MQKTIVFRITFLDNMQKTIMHRISLLDKLPEAIVPRDSKNVEALWIIVVCISMLAVFSLLLSNGTVSFETVRLT
jgi:hypothetical protein